MSYSLLEERSGCVWEKGQSTEGGSNIRQLERHGCPSAQRTEGVQTKLYFGYDTRGSHLATTRLLHGKPTIATCIIVSGACCTLEYQAYYHPV